MENLDTLITKTEQHFFATDDMEERKRIRHDLSMKMEAIALVLDDLLPRCEFVKSREVHKRLRQLSDLRAYLDQNMDWDAESGNQ